MAVIMRTTITDIGPEVRELLDAGLLILFAAGAPPELAEVSVQHAVDDGASAEAPAVGTTIAIGTVTASITAVGDIAWRKFCDIGHVVVNFNGATSTERPGEICADKVDAATLHAALAPGVAIEIRS
jgi:PTS system glucitol/sorbitol-specific IIA component